MERLNISKESAILLLDALDSLPDQALGHDQFFDGRSYCAAGAILRMKGISDEELSEGLIEFDKDRRVNLPWPEASAIINCSDSGWSEESEEARYARVYSAAQEVLRQ